MRVSLNLIFPSYTYICITLNSTTGDIWATCLQFKNRTYWLALSAAPPSVHYFKCDLSSPASIKSTASAVRSTLGDPTILTNNAGLARGKTILTTIEQDLRLTFNVNTPSRYFLAQEFLPSIVRANHGM